VIWIWRTSDEIRRSVGDVGNVNNIGRSVTWTSYASPTSQRKLQLSVSTRSGRTVIRGFEDLSQLSGGIFGGITGGAGGGLGGMTFGITMGVDQGGAHHRRPLRRRRRRAYGWHA
jgi:hypothetical protein